MSNSRRPPYGLHVPCRSVKAIDGDTVEVVALTGFQWRIRLLDCWCHELRRGPEYLRVKARAARDYAQHTIDDAALCSLYVPAPVDIEQIVRAGVGVNPLDIATFNRVLAHIYVSDDRTLSDLMVRAGHAYRTKTELEDEAARLAAKRAA